MSKSIRLSIISLLCLLSFGTFGTTGTTSAQNDVTFIAIQENAWLNDVKRLGINVGSPDRFGAGQYAKNIISNPGFEASEFATIIVTDEDSTATRFQQDNWETDWYNEEKNIGHPPGFWDGATYEIVTGHARGQMGLVNTFTHEDGRYTYEVTSNNDDPRNAGDEELIILRKQESGFEGGTSPYATADRTTTRPDSPGQQSIYLQNLDNNWQPSYTFYFDSFGRDGDRSAGKLLHIEGNWRFEIWAKGEKDFSNFLDVKLQRGNNNIVFMEEKFNLTSEWQKLSFDFYVPIGTDAPVDLFRGDTAQVLSLGLRVSGDNAVWVDDVALYRTDYTNPTAFTDKYVNALKELDPGIVRNWGDQLGSTLENQLAPAFGRKLTEHSPEHPIATNFHYSIHEFLELADELNAEPWYVIPPTFTRDELEGLIEYLAAPEGESQWADIRAELGQRQPWINQFDTIHLEFGNEMWGGNAGADPFIGATARNGLQLGTFAGERIGMLKGSPYFDDDKMNTIIGGQFQQPNRQNEIEKYSPNHDSIAVAPYFGYMDEWDDELTLYQSLFARPWQDQRIGLLAETIQQINREKRGTDTAIYEINFHTTTGDMPTDLRNDFVTNLNGGLALPLYMLSYQKRGIYDQAAFSAVQFSYRMANGEYVRVWGMLRDLEATGRKRPTWLGVELANRAIRGDMLITSHTGENPTYNQSPMNEIFSFVEVPYVQSFAYSDGDTSSVVLFNLDLDSAHDVVLNLESAADPTALLHQLTSDSFHDNNEDEEKIRIETTTIRDFEDGYRLTLPKHSVQVITWGTNGNPQTWQRPTQTPLPQPPTETPRPTPTPKDPVDEVPSATPTIPTATPEPTETPTPSVTDTPKPTAAFTEDEFSPHDGTIITPTPEPRTIIDRGYDFVRYRIRYFALLGLMVLVGFVAIARARRWR